jgi:hypothetical protein
MCQFEAGGSFRGSFLAFDDDKTGLFGKAIIAR